MLIGSWVDLGVLLGVIFVKTSKPAGGDTGVLTVAAATVVLCAALPFALLPARVLPVPKAEAAVEVFHPGLSYRPAPRPPAMSAGTTGCGDYRVCVASCGDSRGSLVRDVCGVRWKPAVVSALEGNRTCRSAGLLLRF
jgi:hypothetical protein